MNAAECGRSATIWSVFCTDCQRSSTLFSLVCSVFGTSAVLRRSRTASACVIMAWATLSVSSGDGTTGENSFECFVVASTLCIVAVSTPIRLASSCSLFRAYLSSASKLMEYSQVSVVGVIALWTVATTPPCSVPVGSTQAIQLMAENQTTAVCKMQPISTSGARPTLYVRNNLMTYSVWVSFLS